MNINNLLGGGRYCHACNHPVVQHGFAAGTDGGVRIYCRACPLTLMRLLGDEGVYSAMPFFVEGPLGPPAPCFEDKSARVKMRNYLSVSPTLQHDGSIRFSGVAFAIRDLEKFHYGANVRGDHSYKAVLWWEQEGRCNGCRDYKRFEDLEMDRIDPGAHGGRYAAGNVQLLCGPCNKIKGDRSMEYLKSRLRERGKIA